MKKRRRILLSRARLDTRTRCFLYAELQRGKARRGRFILRVEVSGLIEPIRTEFTIAYGDSTSLNAFCAGEGLSVYAGHVRKFSGSAPDHILECVEWARKSLVSMCERNCVSYTQCEAETVGGLRVYFERGYVRSVVYDDKWRRMWLRPDCSSTWEVALNDARYLVKTSVDDIKFTRAVNSAIERMYVERLLDVCKM